MRLQWLFVVLLLSGCYTAKADEVIHVQHHSLLANESVTTLQPVYWKVLLKDTWNKNTYEVTMNDYGFFQKEVLDEQLLREYAAKLANDIDTPMTPAKITDAGTIIEGTPRIIFSEDEFVTKMMTLPTGVSTMNLPIYVTKPNGSFVEIEGIDGQKIGQFTTYFNPHVHGRAHNIALSAKEISNVVLGPGDFFSFNNVVGERTVERGYKEAMEIVNKQFVVGIGGGICQTSSTLYNAVEEAQLEIIERISHSRHVGYVQVGKDATVSWGGPDFTFANPHPFPVLLRSNVNLDIGEITITVYTYKNNAAHL